MLGQTGDVVQLALDGLRIVGGQHRRVGEELLAADQRDARMIGEPGPAGVGGDEDPPDPRRVHVHRTQCVLQLVDLPEPCLGVVAVADHVAVHPLGPLGLPLQDEPSTHEKTRSMSKSMSVA